MKTSSSGIEFIKSFEGLSLKPYKDANGYSIGYGHFIMPDEQYLMSGISENVANALLEQDIKKAENIVNSRITYPLNQNQFDALVSLAFNIPIALTSGTVDDKLNAGRIAEVLETWEKYNKVKDANGTLVFNQGLHERRKKEIELFTRPVFPSIKNDVDKKKF